jgi:UDP-4-amino-4,6-dideoxy-N-acetyl-beta-L-altrosamine N-acetyltransferase
MKYTKYGITISLMKEDDIEMVRQWRNDPVVVNNYEYKEYITPEMQKEWFRTVNNTNNLYGIIEYAGEKIGVINMKNINWKEHSGESGIFIPDPKYHKTSLPAILAFMTTEIQFSVFRWSKVYAHILRDNKQVQSFLKSFGFELCPGEEDNFNQKYFNTEENFLRHSKKIRKAVKILTGGNDVSTFLVEPSDFRDELSQKWLKGLLGYITPDKVEETGAGRVYYFT